MGKCSEEKGESEVGIIGYRKQESFVQMTIQLIILNYFLYLRN